MSRSKKNEIIKVKTTKFDQEANRREKLLKYKPDFKEMVGISDLYMESINAKIKLLEESRKPSSPKNKEAFNYMKKNQDKFLIDKDDKDDQEEEEDYDDDEEFENDEQEQDSYVTVNLTKGNDQAGKCFLYLEKSKIKGFCYLLNRGKQQYYNNTSKRKPFKGP